MLICFFHLCFGGFYGKIRFCFRFFLSARFFGSDQLSLNGVAIVEQPGHKSGDINNDHRRKDG